MHSRAVHVPHLLEQRVLHAVDVERAREAAPGVAQQAVDSPEQGALGFVGEVERDLGLVHGAFVQQLRQRRVQAHREPRQVQREEGAVAGHRAVDQARRDLHQLQAQPEPRPHGQRAARARLQRSAPVLRATVTAEGERAQSSADYAPDVLLPIDQREQLHFIVGYNVSCWRHAVP